MIFQNNNDCQNGKKKKKISHKNILNTKLKLAIKSISKVTDYLDVTLDLSNCIGKPYEKPNNYQRNINTKLNHLLTVLRKDTNIYFQENFQQLVI